MNALAKAKAEVGRAKQLKAEEKRAKKEERLDSIELLENASRETLSQLTVPQLDQQIDKLRALDKTVRAKSTIKKKQDKIEEIYLALERYRQRLSEVTAPAWSNVGDAEKGEREEALAGDEISDDEEMRFDDED
ncbi:hypothetical protein FRC12_003471 [Ceratobasidium sp. 428]|nr:hypothetical protein FRC12_003471 [Ceratobasidium sp. 428]